jgi:predicted unusual protein kinase regulating ubiquinone biosynthesis (AarF/ABC1/UbiB family)
MLRFFGIIFLLLKYFIIFLLLKFNLYKKPKQKIVKNFFEEMGGAFIKFGQLLAMRVDVLPREYSLEMLDLFDNVKPFPYKEVETIFLEEMGTTPDKIFKDFQKEPFASASFGQVHGAKLENDHIVAVKVLRPGIETKVAIDFIIIDVFAFVADLFFKIDALTWREFAKEFKTWTKNELDYQIEAANLEKMYRNVSVNPSVIVPKVYPQISTRRILVEDYIEGIPLSRILRGLKDGRLTTEKLEGMGIDIKKVPSVFTQELLREFLIDDVFHADPHPGNILVLKNGRIALLDFGIVGETLKNNKAPFVKFMESELKIDMTGLNLKDFKEPIYYFAEFTADELKSIIGSSLPASFSQERLEEVMKLLSEHFAQAAFKLASSGIPKLISMKTDYAALFLQVLKAAQEYRIKLPENAAVFICMLSIVGFLSKELNKDYRINGEIKYFFETHPVETILKEHDYSASFKRINRERALEKLNSWLSYLAERDNGLYQLVKEKLKEYNAIDN